MPVCLKCGKEIESGNEYCENCRATDEEQVKRLAEIAAVSRYRPPRHRGSRWFVVSMIGLSVILISIALAVALSVPTGTEFREKAQAGVCRANMRRIEKAIDQFCAADGKYPPAGKLDGEHPLVTDQYMDEPPRCPTTGHYYIIEPGDAKPTVKCDSGLPGHQI